MFRCSESWKDSARKSRKNEPTYNQIRHVDEGTSTNLPVIIHRHMALIQVRKCPLTRNRTFLPRNRTRSARPSTFPLHQSHNVLRTAPINPTTQSIPLDQGATPGDEEVLAVSQHLKVLPLRVRVKPSSRSILRWVFCTFVISLNSKAFMQQYSMLPYFPDTPISGHFDFSLPYSVVIIKQI